MKTLRPGPLPEFTDWEGRLKKTRGFRLFYSRQCPWVARFVAEMKANATAERLGLTVREFRTARAAQKAPSVYSVFTLVYDGKLLADHYISMTRFSNILRQLSKNSQTATRA